MYDQHIRILLIEDNPADQRLILELLGEADIDASNIVSVSRLSDALQHLERHVVDVVLMDLNLPDCVGLDALSAVRRQASRVPIIVLGGAGDRALVVTVLQMGAQDCLMKGELDSQLLARSLYCTIQRKRIESSLGLERDFTEGLVESVQAILLLLDRKGHILRLNTYATERAGLELSQVLGEDWLSVLIPDSDQAVMKQMFEQTSATDKTCLGNSRLTTSQGEQLRVRWAGRAIRDERGRVEYTLFTGHDITDLEQAQQRALHAERLAAIGQMITGLAHESRNALQRSQACLAMLTRVIEDNPRALDYAARLQRAQDQVQYIFEEVRDYAAPLQLVWQQCDLNRLIEETWAHLADVREGRDARLEIHSTGLELNCVVDFRRIQQVYRNILENAIEACQDPVRITVDWSEVETDRQPAVRATVRDNGCGFSADQRECIFQPFYTTKTSGTGLGLAITKRIVESHGGQIELGGGSNGGAEILITLPRRSQR